MTGLHTILTNEPLYPDIFFWLFSFQKDTTQVNPGEAGKSQVFDALCTFYAALGDSDILRVTSPT